MSECTHSLLCQVLSTVRATVSAVVTLPIVCVYSSSNIICQHSPFDILITVLGMPMLVVLALCNICLAGYIHCNCFLYYALSIVIIEFIAFI